MLDVEQTPRLCLPRPPLRRQARHGRAASLAAKERGCDIALYGHTHEADVHEEEGVLVVNPGCMTLLYPDAPRYCYLVVAGKKAVATVVEVR